MELRERFEERKAQRGRVDSLRDALRLLLARLHALKPGERA
jgi:hypothetical protein